MTARRADAHNSHIQSAYGSISVNARFIMKIILSGSMTAKVASTEM